MRVVGRGHPAIRATHDKTLELTADPVITERATCVIAAAAQLPSAPMAGPVRITVRTGEHRAALDARAVSTWQPGTSLVVRRSGTRTPNTFAVDATATAADLPRELVDALRDGEVTVDIEPLPSPPTLVIASTQVPAAALAAETDAADVIGWRPGEPITGRVLVRTADPLPRYPRAVEVNVETLGLHPMSAVVAAAPWAGPVTVCTTDELDRAPADHLLVIATNDPARLLSRAADVRRCARAVLAADDSDPVLLDTGEAPPRTSGTVWCCLAPATESNALDPSVDAAMRSLLSDGVPTKSIAKVLAALTGVPHRQAYDVVLGLRQG